MAGDKFSFPVIISTTNPDDQFEFGCFTTPGSTPNSPADHLFHNGKLLPHAFPIQSGRGFTGLSRSTSRTSSMSSSSKGSLVSSRSNSTNSRSSNCSSARTSTSEGNSSVSERGLSSNRLCARKEKSVVYNNYNKQQYQAYGGRWQVIAAAPGLKHQGSRSSRSRAEVNVVDGSKKTRAVDEGGGKSYWFGKRILRSFVSACKECHAIKT